MLAALLFDLDGTLANTDPIHFKVWQAVFRGYGMEIDENFYKKRISGRTNPLIIEEFFPNLSVEAGQELAEEKEARFRQRAALLKPLAGLVEILQWVHTEGLKCAVVTNACHKNTRFMLQALELLDSFDEVVLSVDAGAGKPDPAPYQLALQRLGVTPQTSVAFEDAPSGIRSALGAGISTVGIASTQEPSTLREMGAFMAVHDFTEKSLWDWLIAARTA